jgi:hypothetical protein
VARLPDVLHDLEEALQRRLIRIPQRGSTADKSRTR